MRVEMNTVPTKYDLLLKGGKVVDPGQGMLAKRDVAFSNGKVAAVQQDIPGDEAAQVMEVEGKLVVPGLIDLHGDSLLGSFGLSDDSCKTLGRISLAFGLALSHEPHGRPGPGRAAALPHADLACRPHPAHPAHPCSFLSFRVHWRPFAVFPAWAQKKGLFRVPSNLLSVGLGVGLFPSALGRLGDEALLDGLGGDADVLHLAIDDGLDALQVRQKTTTGFVVRVGNVVPGYRTLTGNLTDSRHASAL